jgi:hypothetical protein
MELVATWLTDCTRSRYPTDVLSRSVVKPPRGSLTLRVRVDALGERKQRELEASRSVRRRTVAGLNLRHRTIVVDGFDELRAPSIEDGSPTRAPCLFTPFPASFVSCIRARE